MPASKKGIWPATATTKRNTGLMLADMQQAQANGYTLGVALTDAQIAELKSDIVWLVKQMVT